MKRVLAYMDFDCPTGFGNVSKNLFERLTPFFEKNDIHVDVCATNYGNKETLLYHKNVTVYNAKSFAKNMNDKWYRDGFLKLLQSKPYDLVWMMNDLPVIDAFMSLMPLIRESKVKLMHPEFKVLLYTPIDSPPDPSWLKHANEFDQIVTYTKYGFEEIKKIKRLKNLSIIAHGFDTNNFFEQTGQKEECRKRAGIPQDKFVIGTVNKNQPRKDMANTLIAFAEFKTCLPQDNNAFLYLHTYYDDPTGVNLRMVGDNLGLVWEKDYVMPMHKKYTDGAYTLSDMNDVYNSFDVFVTTSTAEGWGLTLTEAICCELKVIYGAHTSLKEIAGTLIKGRCDQLIKTVQNNDGNAIRYKLNPVQVSNMMLRFWYEYQETQLMGLYQINTELNAYDKIIKKYNWNSIATEWSEIILKLLK